MALQSRNGLTDVQKAFIAPSLDNAVKAAGRFRIVEWPTTRAYRAAMKILSDTPRDMRDDSMWDKYYAYADGVHDHKNVGVTAGLHILLQGGAGLALSPGTGALFGGPAAATNKAFVGVGSGISYWQISNAGGIAAGATSFTTAAGNGQGPMAAALAIGDILYVTDETATAPPGGTAGAGAEVVIVSAVAGSNAAGYTVTFANTPARFAHAQNVYVPWAGRPTAADLTGASKTYRGIDATFPTEGVVNGKATLTWQGTYANADAQYQWNEGLIAAVPAASAPPNANGAGAASGALPGGSILLAYSYWWPSPLNKGSAQISQQYLLSVS